MDTKLKAVTLKEAQLVSRIATTTKEPCSKPLMMGVAALP